MHDMILEAYEGIVSYSDGHAFNKIGKNQKTH